jgi:hypothetical protein
LGLKRNYVKRQGQGSGARRPARWEKWVAALGRCGKRRRDEEEKSRSKLKGPKELREYRKWFLISRIQYLNKI